MAAIISVFFCFVGFFLLLVFFSCSLFFLLSSLSGYLRRILRVGSWKEQRGNVVGNGFRVRSNSKMASVIFCFASTVFFFGSTSFSRTISLIRGIFNLDLMQNSLTRSNWIELLSSVREARRTGIDKNMQEKEKKLHFWVFFSRH